MSDGTHAQDMRRHVRVYLVVFGALAVLTIVTVAVAYLHLPIKLALIVALSIATIKGFLVAGYFMHLVSEKKVIYYTLALTGAFLIFMFILFVGSYHGQEGMHVP